MEIPSACYLERREPPSGQLRPGSFLGGGPAGSSAWAAARRGLGLLHLSLVLQGPPRELPSSALCHC